LYQQKHVLKNLLLLLYKNNKQNRRSEPKKKKPTGVKGYCNMAALAGSLPTGVKGGL